MFNSGNFKIDISNTGLKLASGVSWVLESDSTALKIQDFQKDKDHIVSATCGGWCGHCKPTPSLNVQLDTCNLKKGKTIAL